MQKLASVHFKKCLFGKTIWLSVIQAALQSYINYLWKKGTSAQEKRLFIYHEIRMIF